MFRILIFKKFCHYIEVYFILNDTFPLKLCLAWYLNIVLLYFIWVVLTFSHHFTIKLSGYCVRSFKWHGYSRILKRILQSENICIFLELFSPFILIEIIDITCFIEYKIPWTVNISLLYVLLKRKNMLPTITI